MQLPSATLRDIAGILPDVTRYTGMGPSGITPWMGLSDPLLRKTSAAALSIQYELHQTSQQQELLFEQASFGFIAVDDAIRTQLRVTQGF